jgi:hypothetical protein
MRFQVVDGEGIARSRPCSSRDVAALLAALDEQNGIDVRVVTVGDDGLPCPPTPNTDEIALVKSGASVRGWRLIRGATGRR